MYRYITYNYLGINTLTLLIAFAFIALWWIFFREKIGGPIPNALMKKYSHTPLALALIWGVRACIIFLLALIFLRSTISSDVPLSNPPQKSSVIVLDISKSMETDDLSPSRIEYAKSIILEHSESIGHLGFVIFAGKTFVLSPITTDTRGINYLIETLTTDTINQNENETSGTNIGDALIQASTLFDRETKEKNIILITDGRANTGLDPIIATEALKEKNITLSSLALGSATGIVLNHLVDGRREPLLDSSGNTINGSVDITTLSRMTDMTNGKLIHLSSTEIDASLSEIFVHDASTPLTQKQPILDDRTIALLIALLSLSHLFLSFFFWSRYKTR